ncbi:MAG: RHS repeat-associated core domain-containing protein, partial [Thermoanaerobaculia bacterium]
EGLNWETAPGEWETGFVYMRNRYYDPELGRFTSADPLGYVDGPSLYGFAGGDPLNSRDPMGLYQEDFHFYVVYYMAELALGDSERALRIAYASQFTDDRRLTAPADPRDWLKIRTPEYQRKLRDFHFSDYRGDPVTRATGYNPLVDYFVDKARASKNDFQLGIALHTYADTFSHEGFSWQIHDHNRRSKHPNTPPIGHLQAGHDPDYPYLTLESAEKAADAAVAIYQQLRLYGAEIGVLSGVQIDEGFLRRQLLDHFRMFTGDKSTRILSWYILMRGQGRPVVEYDSSDFPKALGVGFLERFDEAARKQSIWVDELVQSYADPQFH